MVNSSKKRASAGKRGGRAASADPASPSVISLHGATLDLSRAGMPAADSIVDVETLEVAAPPGAPDMLTAAAAAAPSAPAAFTFRIIYTNERNYEGGDGGGLAAAAAPSKKAGKKAAKKAPKKGAGKDAFAGTSRKAAKLSLSSAQTRTYKDVRSLINTLPSHQEMAALDIPKGATSGRVAQEERNVRLKTFLYAASREDDNDFHLILGRDPSAKPEVYMTMELSGLPPENKPSHAPLKAARDAFKAFFGTKLPGEKYQFYDPPIPVTIEGSLFWDASHATGSRPGPQSLRNKMPVVWEVHPISLMEFKH